MEEDDPFKALREILPNIKKPLKGFSSSLFLKEIYNETYTPKVYEDFTENTFISVLYKDFMSAYPLSQYPTILKEYRELNIQNYYGYSLNQYLDLTPYEYEEIKRDAIATIKEESKIAERVQQEQDRLPKESDIGGYNV